MNTELAKLAYCAGPFWSNQDQFRNYVMAPFVSVILRDFISVLRTTSATNMPLVSALTKLSSERVIESSRLTPSLGHAVRATFAPTQLDPVPVALDLLFEFLEETSSFCFSSDFLQPVHLTIEPVILPDASDVRLSWAPPKLEVVTQRFSASFCISKACRKLTDFSSVNSERPSSFIRIGSISVLSDSKQVSFPPLDLNPVNNIDPEYLSSLGTAQRLLSEVTPEYADWVMPVVRYVIPAKPPDEGFTSGSERFNPGVVAMSFPIEVLSAAESLVHEAAHQYYFLLDAVAELCDPGHRVLYYSPLRKSRRTLDNILLAYHAAANIVCLYQLLRAQDSCYQPDDVRLARALSDFDVLGGHLVNNAALTDAGRLLFERLQDLISLRGWEKEVCLESQ